MDGNLIGMPDFLKLTGFHAPWEFDGILVDEERERVELRFSCLAGRATAAGSAGPRTSPRTTFAIWSGSITVF